MRRKVCAVTGTRAEYGLLYWTMKGISADPALELQLVATGMHLSPEFGMTVCEIEKDGFNVDERVEMLLSSDTPAAISASMGLGMIGLSKAFERLRPDMLLVLGDRFEMLSAVAAALVARIPVAHIHGGESTEGLIDEGIRHAITKMSHIHFTSTERYRDRVIRMGEAPERVFSFGAPGVENIHRLELLDRGGLAAALGIPEDKDIGAVTYHPVTLEDDSRPRIAEIIDAVRRFDGVFWVFTFPNADTGSRAIMEEINAFTGANPDRGKVFVSLGQLRYLSLLRHARVLVGNSSSGLIEAPSFGLPAVNIGDRQRGRVRGANVIDVPECRSGLIREAIERGLSREFRDSLRGMHNPYGDRDVSARIVAKLKEVDLGGGLIKKRFYDGGS